MRPLKKPYVIVHTTDGDAFMTSTGDWVFSQVVNLNSYKMTFYRYKKFIGESFGGTGALIGCFETQEEAEVFRRML